MMIGIETHTHLQAPIATVRNQTALKVTSDRGAEQVVVLASSCPRQILISANDKPKRTQTSKTAHGLRQVRLGFHQAADCGRQRSLSFDFDVRLHTLLYELPVGALKVHKVFLSV